MARVEEILEVALIVSETAEHSPTVLERSGAGEWTTPSRFARWPTASSSSRPLTLAASRSAVP